MKITDSTRCRMIENKGEICKYKEKKEYIEKKKKKKYYDMNYQKNKIGREVLEVIKVTDNIRHEGQRNRK